MSFFNGNAFFGPDNGPMSPSYDENAAGQYFMSNGGEKRASFAEANGGHSMCYSRYHKSRYFRGICHDVANPVLANLAFDGTANTLPGTGAGGDPAYLIQRDLFFSQLAAWAGTIWKLWKHNLDVDGAAPYQMALAEKDVTRFRRQVPALNARGSGLLVVLLLGVALGMLGRQPGPRA